MLGESEQGNNKTDKNFDILAEYFDRLWVSEEAERIRCIIELVKRPLHEHVHSFICNRSNVIHRLLEIGPGHGWDAERFGKTVKAYSGIDFSLESCRSLRFKLGLPMIRGLAEKLPIIPGSLDCVYLSTTLMHLQKHQAIENIAISLAANKYFIFIEPLGKHPLLWIYRKFKYRDLTYKYFNRSDLEFVKNRFKTLEERYFGLLFITDTGLEFLNKFLQKTDSWLFRFQFFRRFAWMYLGIYKNLK